MFGWFKKRSIPSLATQAEREAILRDRHAVFDSVDAGFHTYLEVVSATPPWDDSQIEQELGRRGVELQLAQELVAFAPMAFGREIVQQLGVPCSDVYRLHDLTDGSERELPLANERAFAWAKAMIGLYRTAERNDLFKLVACRSAELAAVNNALKAGVAPDDLRKG